MEEQVFPKDYETMPGPIAFVLILFSTIIAVALGLTIWSLAKMFKFRRPRGRRRKGPEK